MTAVLEPQVAEAVVPVQAREEADQWPAASAVADDQGLPMVLDHLAPSVAIDDPAPFHCGVAMTAGPVPIASLGWAPLELGSSEWSCACGHTADGGAAGDPLESVQLASARVESLQWELDAAQERFEKAVRSASRLGAGQQALGRAAGLSAVELQELLAGGPHSL